MMIESAVIRNNVLKDLFSLNISIKQPPYSWDNSFGIYSQTLCSKKRHAKLRHVFNQAKIPKKIELKSP